MFHNATIKFSVAVTSTFTFHLEVTFSTLPHNLKHLTTIFTYPSHIFDNIFDKSHGTAAPATKTHQNNLDLWPSKCYYFVQMDYSLVQSGNRDSNCMGREGGSFCVGFNVRSHDMEKWRTNTGKI